MKDTTKTSAIEVITKSDTITLSVDKKLINHLTHEKSTDTVQVLVIVLPIVAALLIIFLNRLFDNISENKKFRKELLKENRASKVKILKSLNELRTSLHKTSFSNPELEDFYEGTADKMIGVNPFHDLEINCNILFSRDIIDLTNRLYYNADEINRNFNWKKKEHPSESISLGKEILTDLDEIIDKIAQNIKNE